MNITPAERAALDPALDLYEVTEHHTWLTDEASVATYLASNCGADPASVHPVKRGMDYTIYAYRQGDSTGFAPTLSR